MKRFILLLVLFSCNKGNAQLDSIFKFLLHVQAEGESMERYNLVGNVVPFSNYQLQAQPQTMFSFSPGVTLPFNQFLKTRNFMPSIKYQYTHFFKKEFNYVSSDLLQNAYIQNSGRTHDFLFNFAVASWAKEKGSMLGRILLGAEVNVGYHFSKLKYRFYGGSNEVLKISQFGYGGGVSFKILSRFSPPDVEGKHYPQDLYASTGIYRLGESKTTFLYVTLAFPLMLKY